MMGWSPTAQWSAPLPAGVRIWRRRLLSRVRFNSTWWRSCNMLLSSAMLMLLTDSYFCSRTCTRHANVFHFTESLRAIQNHPSVRPHRNQKRKTLPFHNHLHAHQWIVEFWKCKKHGQIQAAAVVKADPIARPDGNRREESAGKKLTWEHGLSGVVLDHLSM